MTEDRRNASVDPTPEVTAAPSDAAVGRHVAPGGAVRMVVGFLVGLLAGALVALLLPRDDGPRRGSLVHDDVVPDAPSSSAGPVRTDGGRDV